MAEPDAPSQEEPASPKVSRVLPLLLALVGLATSGVLEWVHIKTYLMPSVDSFCTVGQTLDCGTVALSRFSVVLGVPLPVWGGAGFLAMLIAAWMRLWLLWPLAAFSAIASVALLLEEVLHVGAICMMCEVVHVVALLLAIIAWRSHRRHGEASTLGARFNVLGLPATLVLGTMLFAPAYWAPYAWQTQVPHAHGTTDDGHPWVGAEDPTITVEEFVDYGCPHCAVATNLTRRRLAKHDDSLRVVRRHQPRMRCKLTNKGCLGLRAAHCAGKQGKFWEMDAWLFARMPGRGDADVLEGARDLKLDEPSFMLCLEDPETYEWAHLEYRAARKLRIIETPTYRVDGEKMLMRQMLDLLDQRL